VANLTNHHLNQGHIANLSLVHNKAFWGLSNTNNAIDMLFEEGGERFFNYVTSLGVLKEPDLIVLTSKHHYYYDPEEMKNIKTIINIKELNHIKPIMPFLHSCLDFLPEKSNFIGCFIDFEKLNGYESRNLSDSDTERMNTEDQEYGVVSRFQFINIIYSLIDSKTDRHMSKKSVSLLLQEYGFKVMDMTAYHNFTYFHSQKINFCN
jgi:hypothetical protein